MKTRLLGLFIVLAIVLAFIPTQKVFAATPLYVRTDGDDSCTGLTDAAWSSGVTDCAKATINAAIIAATSGDTINVADGTYNGAVMIDKGVTLKSVNGAATTIIHGGPTPGAIYVVSIRASNVVLDGFTVMDPNYDNPQGDVTGIMIGYYGDNSLSNIRVTNNIVTQIGSPTRTLTNSATDWPSVGIVVNGVIAGLEIDHNTIHDITQIVTTDAAITYGATAIGFYGYDTTPLSTGVSIHDNTIYNITATSVAPANAISNGIRAGWGSGDVTISNNTVHDVDGRGIMATTSNNGTVIVSGNTVYNTDQGVYIANPDGGSVNGNNIYNNGTGIFVGVGVSPTPTISGNTLTGNTFPISFPPVHNVTADTYFTGIQAAVTAASMGDTIEVSAGTYTEQVFINKSLHLIGADTSTTIIKAPASIPGPTSQDGVIVKIFGSGVDVELAHFTISGPGPTNCGSMGYGLFVRDGANSNIHDNLFLDIRDNPFSGCQNGVALIVGRNYWSTTGTATITNNTFTGWQKAAIVVDNTGSNATITNNIINGAGATATTAQNGIQISRGANATVTGNTINNISWTPASWTAAGILLYNGGAVTASGNTLTDTQMAINSSNTNGTISGNTINLTTAGTGSPVEGIIGIAIDGGTMLIQNNTITNDLTPNGYGITSYAGYGTTNTNVTITGNIVSGFVNGIMFDRCTTGCSTGDFTGITFNHNQFIGSTNPFIGSGLISPINGGSNWWGGADDPGLDLALINYDPWCADNVCDTLAYFPGDLQGVLNGLAPDSTFTLVPGTYNLDSGFDLTVPGTTLIIEDGANITSASGPCFLVNADNITIKANSPSGAKCTATRGFSGLELGKAVSNLTVMNMEFDGSAAGTLDGLNIGYYLSNFKFINNYIHNFGSDGIKFSQGSTVTGSTIITGNWFSRNNGFGLNNLTPTIIDATFNSWGDVRGPNGVQGDKVNGKVNFSNFTHLDLFAVSSGTIYPNQVELTKVIKYTVKANAASVNGIEFNLNFDKNLLQIAAITDTMIMTHDSVCKINSVADANSTGVIHYCGKGRVLNGLASFYVVTFNAKTTVARTPLHFDGATVQFASSSLNASNFVYPNGYSDVSLNIYNASTTTYNINAKVLLQGREDYSGTTVTLAGLTPFGPTSKWGDVSLSAVSAGTYKISFSRPGYIDLPISIGRLVTINAGKTELKPITLIAGDVNNDEKITLLDVVAIANDFGHSGSAILNPLCDINQDGKVNLLDMVIVAGNFNKTYASYSLWRP